MIRRLAVLLLGCLLAAGAAADERPATVFLVATTRMADPHFRQTVVLVTQHGGGGPVGVVINRPTPVPLKQIFPGNPGLADGAERVYSGGPVSQGMLVFVFRAAEAPRNAVALLDGLYMSFDPELLRELLARPDPVAGLRVFAGYSGWSPGQLEREIARGDWLLTRADAETVFRRDPGRVWQEMRGRASARQVRGAPAAAPPRLARH